jgi:hypothetical protein
MVALVLAVAWPLTGEVSAVAEDATSDSAP